jgi:hypothetical protein
LNGQSAAPQTALQGRPQNVIAKRLSSAFIKYAELEFGLFFDIADIASMVLKKSPIRPIVSITKKLTELTGGLWIYGSTGRRI